MEFVNLTKVVEKRAYKEGDWATFSQSPTIFLLSTMGNAIHWFLGRWSMLLYLFLNPPVIHSLTLTPTNVEYQIT
jgi:hypothetical protein